MAPPATTPRVLAREAFDELLGALRARGYRLAGPTVRDRAIVHDEIGAAADLPAGWTADEEAGRYRLRRRGDEALFGYSVGPDSWKRFLHPPEQRLLRARRDGDGSLALEAEPVEADAWALLGVRSCDLHAIASLDRVFLGGRFVDPAYEARRRRLFVVAVNCGEAGGTCFCASTGTGPRATLGYDLVLTELLGRGDHRFVVAAGTDAGAEVLASLPTREAGAGDLEAAERAIERAAAQMGRELDTDGLPDLLRRGLEHPRWDEVAERCLACGNCTMVCPTCFCTTVDDVTDLAGTEAERVRRWESCFTLDFSHIHGGSVRSSGRSRYRQWLTHKLGTWEEQLGGLGCVGCGRCIAWCPVGIDITEEAAAIRQQEVAGADA